MLPEWKAAEDWLEAGRQIQEVLLLNQVYPDGFQVAHTLHWTLRCPDKLREVENRTVVSAGDPGIRLAPAWSDAIHDVEIGWGPSMVPLTYRQNMSAQKAQVCHVRFVQEIDAGAQARFLVLMISGECQDGAIQGEVADGRIEVTVTAWGETERIVLK